MQISQHLFLKKLMEAGQEISCFALRPKHNLHTPVLFWVHGKHTVISA